MTYAPLIIAVLTLLAALAHVFIGTRETASLEPEATDDARRTHWVQAQGAFQMLSVDLLVVAGLLFWIAFAEVPMEATLQFALGLLFLFWGLAWLIQMKLLGNRGVSVWKLPHWALWLFCAAVLLWP